MAVHRIEAAEVGDGVARAHPYAGAFGAADVLPRGRSKRRPDFLLAPPEVGGVPDSPRVTFKSGIGRGEGVPQAPKPDWHIGGQQGAYQCMPRRSRIDERVDVIGKR